MPENCYFCGHSEIDFINLGRLGCEYCINYLSSIEKPKADYSRILRQFHSIPTNDSLENLKERITDWKSAGSLNRFYYRYRLSRNRKNSFFEFRKRSAGTPAYNLLSEHFPDLIHCPSEGNCEFWIRKKWKKEESDPVRARTFRFRIGDEDEIRFEMIGDIEDPSLIPSLDPRFHEVKEFFSRRELFSFRRDCGYINSCPSNFGRGDRYSLVMDLSGMFDNQKDRERRLWEDNGFSVSVFESRDGEGDLDSKITAWMLSVKNFNFRRKFYFQHTLVPLIFKSSGLIR